MSSCAETFKRFEDDVKLDAFGAAQKIEYYKARDLLAFQVSDSASFIISNGEEIECALAEIKRANHPSLWKGAGWNLIKIYYKDTAIWLNTNDKVIGTKG